MTSYQELLQRYQKRRHDTLVDTLSAGLTFVDELAVETGLLDEAGLWAELTDSVTGVLPFVIIAATEGSKVILGRKPTGTGMKDGAFRMVKTGAAMGVGAAAATAAGAWVAIPTTMCVRALFDRYKSKALTSHRVQGRIDRLRALNAHIRGEDIACEAAVTEVQLETVTASGAVE